MTEKSTDAQHVTAEILELRALRERTSNDTAQLRRTEKEMIPVWGRLVARRVENSFGKEYDLSMTPRGATS